MFMYTYMMFMYIYMLYFLSCYVSGIKTGSCQTD